MAGLFKRFGRDTPEHKDKDAPEGGKLYGSLRALRSPIRVASPAKRRSRSLEIPSEFTSTPRESAHARQASMPETQPPRPESTNPPPATRPTSFALPASRPTTIHRDQGNTARSSAAPSSGTATPPKRRGSFLKRALNSFRHSAFSPGHSALSTAAPPKSETPLRQGTMHPRTRPTDPAAEAPTSTSPEDTEGMSTSGRSSTGLADPRHTEQATTTPRHLPASVSEPPRPSTPHASTSGHITDSVSDPGPPPPTLNIIAATPPRPTDTQKARDDAYTRLVKAERRKSPLSRISTPKLFRRNSADVPAGPLLPRVGSPVLRVLTREEAAPPAAASRTKVTLVSASSQSKQRLRPSRHDSFDFEQPASGSSPASMPAALPEPKVRFMEPVPEGGDGDSGIGGLRDQDAPGAEPPPARLHRRDSDRRASAQAPRVKRTSPPTADDSRSYPGSGPLGTAFSTHGLPLFSFEPVSTSPSPSMQSFSSRASARSAPPPLADPAQPAATSRQHRGRSLDLGIGLAWAPSKVRQEAVLDLGSKRAGKSKWGAGARTSEVLLRDGDMREFGVSPKEDVMHAFKQVLDDAGYTTFKRYCRRYEVGALPLDGPTGVLSHLDRLLENASTASPQARRQILEQFARFAKT